jgi:hypothetical protein
LLSIAT